MTPLPWHLSEIEEHADIKYLIRSEDRNQFPTWICEMSNQGGDQGRSNGNFICRAANSHCNLLASCIVALSRLEWVIDLMRRSGSSLLATTAQATIQGELLIREANYLGQALGPLIAAIADAHEKPETQKRENNNEAKNQSP